MVMSEENQGNPKGKTKLKDSHQPDAEGVEKPGDQSPQDMTASTEQDAPDKTEGEGGSTNRKPRSQHSSFQYIMRAERLIDRFETEVALPWRESQDEFIAWLRGEILPRLAQSSRRQVRAALRYYYQRVGMSPDRIPAAADPAIPKIKRKDVSRRGNTSAGRKKGIRPDDWRKLILALVEDPSVHAQLAGAMLVAGRTFGLRPSEWFDDQTVLSHRNQQVILVAANGKYREDEPGESKRSFAPTRTMIAPMGERGIRPNEIEAVELVISIGRGWVNDIHSQHGMSRLDARAQVIQSLGHKIFHARRKIRLKEKVTLYSARHQFAADAKAAGLTKVEIAALMGHRSIDTAGEHYGRRTAGRTRNPDQTVGFRVMPATESVRAVQSFNQTIEQALVGPKVPSITKWAPDF